MAGETNVRIRGSTLITLFGSLMLAACAISTSAPVTDSGCPAGHVRIDDENTDKYDCADPREYEDILEEYDEHR